MGTHCSYRICVRVFGAWGGFCSTIVGVCRCVGVHGAANVLYAGAVGDGFERATPTMKGINDDTWCVLYDVIVIIIFITIRRRFMARVGFADLS